MKIYHQLGHNSVWDIDSWQQDGMGDGLILSPSRMDRSRVESLEERQKSASIFDPQFFAPDYTRGKLSTYNFFPNVVADGFDTVGFEAQYAQECASACVQFQIENDFRYIVIPARYSPGMRTDFIAAQERLFVIPFLQAIALSGTIKPVLLQMVLNDNMIKDESYASTLLNWVTGIQEISGVYLITQCEPRQKQLQDSDFLYFFLQFIATLAENKLDVVLGYLNVESILLSIASPHIVTVGAYENMRMFNIKTYLELERLGPPRPRIYSSGLLQNIDFDYYGPLTRRLGSEIFDTSPYLPLILAFGKKLNFQRPEIYKHFFMVLCTQLRGLSDLEGRSRYFKVREMIETAISNYGRISALIPLDPGSDGSHLRPWLTAANEFAFDQGWV